MKEHEMMMSGAKLSTGQNFEKALKMEVQKSN